MKNKSFLMSSTLKPNRLIALLCAVVVAITGYAVLQLSKAATPGTINLSPTSVSVTNGQSFNIAVRINSDQSMNAVDAHILYPSNLLDVVTIDTNGSAFPNSAQQSTSAGSIKIGRYSAANTSVTGNQLIATITFKTKAAGSGQVTVASDSAISSDGNEIYGGSTPSTISIAAPAASTPTTNTTPSTTNNSAPATTPTNTGTSKTTPKTNTPTGQTATTPPPDNTPNPANDPGASSTPERIDTNSAKSVNENTKVSITVLDSQGVPVEAARVTIGGQIMNTDKKGQATFNNISLGNQTVDVTANGKSTKTTVSVLGQSNSSTPQNFTVKLASDKSTVPYIVIVPTAVVLLLAGGAFAAYQTGALSALSTRFHPASLPPPPPAVPASTPPATTGDVQPPSPPPTLDERLNHIQTEVPQPSEVVMPTKPPEPPTAPNNPL
jgi:hypothetical protein